MRVLCPRILTMCADYTGRVTIARRVVTKKQNVETIQYERAIDASSCSLSLRRAQNISRVNSIRIKQT